MGEVKSLDSLRTEHGLETRVTPGGAVPAAGARLAKGTGARLCGIVCGWPAAVALALGVFAAIAPTLTWQEFSSGSENLVAATVLEMRRGGPWLVPTLQGKPRTQKPPLAAWVTAAAARPETVADAGSADPVVRDRAYVRLEWQMRWPALASACAMLLAVYGLGRLVAGRPVGIISAAICATSILFLRQARYATTDVQLALWVAATNLALAHAIFKRRLWAGCLTAGAALGLAFISKGPVALVQTGVPFGIWAAWRAWPRWHHRWVSGKGPSRRGFEVVYPTGDAQTPEQAAAAEQRPEMKVQETGELTIAPPARARRRWLAPLPVGLALMLLVGVTWYAYLFFKVGGPGLVRLWYQEVTRDGAREAKPDPWYGYALLLPLMFPWCIFFVVGLLGGATDLWQRRHRRMVLVLLLTLIPPVVMTIVGRERKDRYLLPMVGPAAVLAAWGSRQAWSKRGSRRIGKALAVGHWGLLGVAVVALPILGTSNRWLSTAAGAAWFSRPVGVSAAAVLVAIVLVGMFWKRREQGVLVLATTLSMLGLQALAMYGYARSADGRAGMKPLADAVRAAYPDAIAYYRYNRRVPGDLSIYLNRVVPQIDTWAEAVAGPRSETPVVFTFEKAGRPPTPAPPGWRRISFIGRDEDTVSAWAPQR